MNAKKQTMSTTSISEGQGAYVSSPVKINSVATSTIKMLSPPNTAVSSSTTTTSGVGATKVTAGGGKEIVLSSDVLQQVAMLMANQPARPTTLSVY